MRVSENLSGPASEPGQVIPRHVAIIMDGNNRWAKRRGLPGVAGHRGRARTSPAARPPRREAPPAPMPMGSPEG